MSVGQFNNLNTTTAGAFLMMASFYPLTVVQRVPELKAKYSRDLGGGWVSSISDFYFWRLEFACCIDADAIERKRNSVHKRNAFPRVGLVVEYFPSKTSEVGHGKLKISSIFLASYILNQSSLLQHVSWPC